MCCAKIQMISAVVLLSMCIISSQGAQFYTTPKIHPGKLPLPNMYIYISNISQSLLSHISFARHRHRHSLEYFTVFRAGQQQSIGSGFGGPPSKKRAGDNDGAVLGFGQKHTK